MDLNEKEQQEVNKGDDRGRRKLIAAPPPDGGWGWVVVFATFAIHFLAYGTAFTFGLFFTKIIHSHEVEANKSDASWIGSIMFGIAYGEGPLASVLVNKFGCRAVSIAGSFVAAFGFAISYWATTVHYLYVSVGVIGGLGLGLIYFPTMICVSCYFEKKRAFATGIAICGSGFGTFALAPVFEFMIRRFGWRGAFLCVAAILLLCVIFAALFRPLPPTIVVSIDEVEFQNPNYELELNYGPQQQQLHSQYDLQMESLQGEGEGRMMGGNSNKYSNSNIQSPEAGANFKRDPLNLDFEEISLKTEPITQQMAMTTSVNHIPEEINISTQQQPTKCGKSVYFSLFRNPIFVLFAISNFFTNLGTTVPYIYFPDMAHHNLKLGVDDPSLSWLVSCIGISNILSRLIMGYLSDTKYVKRFYLYTGSLIVCGIGIGLTPYGHTLPYLIVCALVFGFSVGIYSGLISVVLVDFMGLEQLTDSFGIVLLCDGLGALFEPPIVGLLFDTYQHYLYGFLFGGLSVTLSGAILLLIPCIQKSESRKQKDPPRQS